MDDETRTVAIRNDVYTTNATGVSRLSNKQGHTVRVRLAQRLGTRGTGIRGIEQTPAGNFVYSVITGL